MKPNTIRPIAICVFRHDDRILAIEFRRPDSGAIFYRPAGGGIEFGEHSADTMRRELREELGAEVRDLRYLGTLENVFTYDGQVGHEIVMVYDGVFADPTLYDRPVLEGLDDGATVLRLVWLSLAGCRRPDAPPLYPTGLLELLDEDLAPQR